MNKRLLETTLLIAAGLGLGIAAGAMGGLRPYARLRRAVQTRTSPVPVTARAQQSDVETVGPSGVRAPDDVPLHVAAVAGTTQLWGSPRPVL